MEEEEYKATYNELASICCVFEKALTNKQAKCRLSRHFCLADREGYSCENEESSENCCKYLEKLRENSRFALASAIAAQNDSYRLVLISIAVSSRTSK